MGNFKEGEGVAVIAPTPFTSSHLKPSAVYQVIVMAGTEVVEIQWVPVIKPGTVTASGHMGIYAYPNDWFRLVSQSRMFYAHYTDNYDVLIKDSDGRTIKALLNVEVIREE